jgi:uncharacterized membrane protein
MTEILVLRLVHVLGGIFWVGSGVFSALFLTPALMALGPAAGQVMAELQRRRLFAVLPTVAVLTIASGLRLMWLTSGGFSRAYFATPMGAAFAAGGAAAVAAFLLSLMVARPAHLRSAALAAKLAGAPDDAARTALTSEIGALQRRSAAVGTLVPWLLVGSAAAMAVARYLR